MIEIVNTLKGILSVLEDIAEALTPADDSKATPADEPKQDVKEEAEEPKEEPKEEPETPAETKAESTRKVSAKK